VAESSKKRWTPVKFGEVVRQVKDRVDPSDSGLERYVAGDHMDTDDLRIRTWGVIGDGYLGPAFHMRFKPGQVLYGSRRTYLRKVVVADFEGITANTTFVIEPRDPDVLLPAFLPFVMQSESFHAYSINNSKGSVNPYINFSDLARYEFDLPAPEEQRRMAEALNAAFGWYSSVRNILDSATALKAAFGRYVLSRRPDLPRAPLGTIVKFSSGAQIQVGALPQLPTDIASVPVYGGNGLAGYVSEPLQGCTKATVVVGRVGQYCGTTLLTEGPAWITDNALYPALLKSPTDMRFLAACLEGANLNTGKLGEYLPLVTQKVVHAVEIPIVPLDEQEALGRRYQDIIDTIRSTARRVAEAEVIRKKTVARLLGEGSQI
jgi:hypothetical protein